MDGAELADSGCLFQRVAEVCLWMKLGATPCSAIRWPTAMRWYRVRLSQQYSVEDVVVIARTVVGSADRRTSSRYRSENISHR